MQTFISYLEEKFIQSNVFGDSVITKENTEDLFEEYLQGLDKNNLIAIADSYGELMFEDGLQQKNADI